MTEDQLKGRLDGLEHLVLCIAGHLPPEIRENLIAVLRGTYIPKTQALATSEQRKNAAVQQMEIFCQQLEK